MSFEDIASLQKLYAILEKKELTTLVNMDINILVEKLLDQAFGKNQMMTFTEFRIKGPLFH